MGQARFRHWIHDFAVKAAGRQRFRHNAQAVVCTECKRLRIRQEGERGAWNSSRDPVKSYISWTFRIVRFILNRQTLADRRVGADLGVAYAAIKEFGDRRYRLDPSGATVPGTRAI